MTLKVLVFMVGAAAASLAGGWSAPGEVEHDDKRVLAYKARWDGDHLVVQAKVEPGWHTFAMDNKQRHVEKLAGKASLGVEKSTEIKVENGLETEGGWLQSEPKDFSQPEIRAFTFGFDGEALFAIKAKQTGAGPAKVEIRGQACRESICKNIDVVLSVPVEKGGGAADVKGLVGVRR
jgi:DsbC/DsbD-like thiol-disulfide interchange protein